MSTEYGIVGDWIVQSVDGCTCGAGFGTLPHEPGCGAEPLERVSVALAAADEIESVRAALGRAETQLATARKVIVQADSLCSLILHRESRDLSPQTKSDLDALVHDLRRLSDPRSAAALDGAP